MRFIHTDDDMLFVSQDNSDEWFDVPRPITSMPAPKKGQPSLIGDGAIVLWLPSTIPTWLRSDACVDGLATKETALRVADCADNLHNIRRSLRELSRFSSYRSKNMDGQRQQTRALGTLKALCVKRDRYVARYRCSRVAWLSLDPDQSFEDGKWKNVLRNLKQTDLTFPGDDEEANLEYSTDDELGDGAMGSNTKKRPGEGYKRITWIWRVQKQDARDIPGLDDSSAEEDVYKCKIFYL